MIRKDNKGNILEKGIYYSKTKDTYYHSYINNDFRKNTVYAKTLPKLYRRIENLKSIGVIQQFDEDDPTLDMYFHATMRLKYKLNTKYMNTCIQKYEKYVSPRLGSMKIKDIIHDDLVLLYKELVDRGLSLGTVENIHGVLSGVFKRAAKNDIIRKDVSFGAFYSNFDTNARKRKIKEERNLSFDETDMLFSEISKNGTLQDMHIATVLFGTGMRLGELIGLTWNDIDFDSRTIRIDHQLAVTYGIPELTDREIKDLISENLYDDGIYWDTISDVKPRFSIKHPKSRSSVRTIPMIDDVYDALRDEYRIQRQFGIYCSEKIDDYSGFIFINKLGEVRKHDSILYMFDRYVTSCNLSQRVSHEVYGFEPHYLRHISTHMARHTFCSRLLAADVSPKVTQELMGHAHFSTTNDVYNEVTFDLMIKTMTDRRIEVL